MKKDEYITAEEAAKGIAIFMMFVVILLVIIGGFAIYMWT